MAWDEALVMHALNPRWQGPLCQYEIAESVRVRRRAPLLTDEQSLVTCVNCLRRMGVLPKQTMPGQAWLLKRKRELLGGING